LVASRPTTPHAPTALSFVRRRDGFAVLEDERHLVEDVPGVELGVVVEIVAEPVPGHGYSSTASPSM
jgi:hypothetical protein